MGPDIGADCHRLLQGGVGRAVVDYQDLEIRVEFPYPADGGADAWFLVVLSGRVRILAALGMTAGVGAWTWP